MTNKQITPVILAGGSGTRLWPVSRETMPKQFCRLEGDTSLFQQTVLRVSDRSIFERPVIVASERHRDLVDAQLAEIGIQAQMTILEPMGRDTTAAILLATELCINDNQSLMMVLPSDHKMAAPLSLVRAAQKAVPLTRDHQCIVTFGICPTRPETGFGYIQAGAPVLNCGGYLLNKFIEKPDLEKAESLISRADTFWNAGIFMFDRNVLRQEARQYASKILSSVQTAVTEGIMCGSHFTPCPDAMKATPAISFDYSIMERTDRAAVVPCDPRWSDMGSWNAVWEASVRDKAENFVTGNAYCVETTGSIVISDGPAVGVAGLDDVVVVANRDAVLVTSRSNPQNVRDLVDTMKIDGVAAVTHQTGEDRPWGRFDSIDRGDRHQVKRIRVDAGGQLSLQYHHNRAEHWVVITGTARVTVGGVIKELKPCEQVFIPKGAVHRLENLTDEPVEIIEVQYGDYLGEDDIVRVEDVYNRSSPETAAPIQRQAA